MRRGGSTTVTIDTYTKAVLTVIAVCLVVLCVRDIRFVGEVRAASTQDVQVTNYETDVRNGETLYVLCKNCN